MSRVGINVKCSACGRTKKPVGRDSRDNGLCDHECPGYYEDPPPDYLWPGEIDEAADPLPCRNSQSPNEGNP